MSDFYLDDHIVNMGELRERFIAIDTEYFTGGTDRPQKIFCFACMSASGRVYKEWIDTPHDPSALRRIASRFGVKDPIFCCHALDKAEYPALDLLGCEPWKYRWFDTYAVYKLCKNDMVAYVDTREQTKEIIDGGLSLAAMCQNLLGITIDTDHKTEMRGLCIRNETEGHELEILDYCAEDVANLWPCVERLVRGFEQLSSKAVLISPRNVAGIREDPGAVETLLRYCDSMRAFARIASRGLPVSTMRCDALREGARKSIDTTIDAFVEKYPGAFYRDTGSTATLEKRAPQTYASIGAAAPFDLSAMLEAEVERYAPTTKERCRSQLASVLHASDALWKRDDKQCEKYLRECLYDRGALNRWPRTASGRLSMSSEDLSEEFKTSDHVYEAGFGGDFLALASRLTSLRGVSGMGKRDWLSNVREGRMYYNSLRPHGTITGRCAPSSASGFVFAWDKSLYCIMDPPRGKWLVELDYGSEETYIQARVYHDDAYLRVYQSKDPYLWVCAELDQIPREDFEQLSKKELKAKYHDVRTRLKTFFLAWSYGCGVAKLSRKAKIDPAKVEQLKRKLEAEVFSKSTRCIRAIRDTLDSPRSIGAILEDGFYIRTAPKSLEIMKSLTTMRNWPIQSYGAVILRKLVVELERLGVKTLATIHDAVFFEVKAGDYDTIELVADTMRRVADYYMATPEGSPGIKVGSPEIIEHGVLWTPEHEFDNAAWELLEKGGISRKY